MKLPRDLALEPFVHPALAMAQPRPDARTPTVCVQNSAAWNSAISGGRDLGYQPAHLPLELTSVRLNRLYSSAAYASQVVENTSARRLEGFVCAVSVTFNAER